MSSVGDDYDVLLNAATAKLAEREKWFEYAISAWKEEEKDWIERERRLEEALRAAEWNGSAWIGLATCPVCGGEKPKHASDCELAAALAGGTPQDTTRLVWQDEEGDVRCPRE